MQTVTTEATYSMQASKLDMTSVDKRHNLAGPNLISADLSFGIGAAIFDLLLRHSSHMRCGICSEP